MKYLITILVVVLLIGGYFWFTHKPKTQATQTPDVPQTPAPTASAPATSLTDTAEPVVLASDSDVASVTPPRFVAEPGKFVNTGIFVNTATPTPQSGTSATPASTSTMQVQSTTASPTLKPTIKKSAIKLSI